MTTHGTARDRQLPELHITYEDDPRVVKDAATEDYSTHVVPNSWRSSRLSLGMAWAALFSAMFWLYIAAITATTVGTANAVVGIMLTVGAYGGINYVLSRYANRTGLTVALMSRRLFGYEGSALAPLIFAATAIYYAVFEGSIVAVALQDYFGGHLKLWYLGVVIYSVPLVIGGVRVWLDRFNGFLLPFYVAGLVALVVWAHVKHGGSLSLPNPEAELAAPGWLWAFTVYMGVYIMMMYTIDFARFGKPKDATFHGVVTFGPVFYLATFLVNGLVGIYVAATVPGVVTEDGLTETGIINGIVGVMGIFGVLLIFVSQTRINTANVYLASTNLEAFCTRTFKIKMPRVAWAVIAGAIIYLIMLTDVLSYILRALNWQGVFVVAWVGIALTHIALTYFTELLPEFRPGRVKPVTPAVAVWFLSSGVGIYLVEQGGAFGATWSAPIALALSVLGYLAVAGYRAVLVRGNDPRDEVADIWEARIRCHSCNKSYVAVEMDRDPSADQQAICSECASESGHFYRAARQEARQPVPATSTR